MKKENSVVFKGRKNGITIALDESVDFDTIKKVLTEKMKDAQSFFGDAKTAISFSGRNLSEAEETELVEIISKTTDLSISFVTNEGIVKTVKNTKPKSHSKSEHVISADENITMYRTGSLRSGQSIRFVGSVMLIGDVNPGAEIIAEGNVTVLGSIKGLVHAGCSGNENCFIAALDLAPTQLRISDIITYIPKQIIKENKGIASHAYVENGQIYIVPLNMVK